MAPGLAVAVIPNGVDLPDWRSDTSGQPARGVVVANFHDYKGYDVLLESLTRVTEPVTVHLCGTGDVRVIRHMVYDVDESTACL